MQWNNPNKHQEQETAQLQPSVVEQESCLEMHYSIHNEVRNSVSATVSDLIQPTRRMYSNRWRSPFAFLIVASIALPFGESTWQALLNNFAVDQVGFTGLENGIMQSLREIPGLLVFTTVFFLLVMREQLFAVVSLALFGVGVAITGLLPSTIGLYCSVVLVSFGFHYFEVTRQSLSLQWLPKQIAPRMLGKLMAYGSISALVTYGLILLATEVLSLSFVPLYACAGTLVVVLVLYLQFGFPKFESEVQQRPTLILKPRYWLYFLLTLLSGARRQIFVAFAGFLLVEKFGFSIGNMTVLLLVNHVATWLVAERIGALIGKIGERRALTIEYIAIALVFVGYALVNSGLVAAVLYVVDNLFFSFAIAIRTYFQKIADPEEIAGAMSVSFTINHILAVILPACLGIVWLTSRSAVFLIGSVLAVCSLGCSQFVPRDPRMGNETTLGGGAAGVASQQDA